MNSYVARVELAPGTETLSGSFTYTSNQQTYHFHSTEIKKGRLYAYYIRYLNRGNTIVVGASHGRQYALLDATPSEATKFTRVIADAGWLYRTCSAHEIDKKHIHVIMFEAGSPPREAWTYKHLHEIIMKQQHTLAQRLAQLFTLWGYGSIPFN